MFKPNILVLSGGALRGIEILGALRACEEKRILDKISVFIGTSIGAIICLLLSLSAKPYNIYKKLLEYDVFFPISFEKMENETKGLLNTNLMFKIIQDIVPMHDLKTLTFLNHYLLTNTILIVTSFNIKTCKEKIFSYSSTPNVTIIDSLKNSSGIPLMFNTNKEYIDGGIWDNFPISHANLYPGDILGITLTRVAVQRLTNMQSDSMKKIILLDENKNKFILVGNRQQKYALFLSGYRSACKQLVTYDAEHLKRRNSI